MNDTLATTSPAATPVLTPIGTDATAPWDCPYCGANSAQGPEKDAWSNHWHCWSCGFNPSAQGGISGVVPAMIPGTTKAVATQLAAEIQSQLGLPPGVNLGDVLAQLKAHTEPAAAVVAGGEP